MERRRLGALGHDSSVLVYGAAALGEVDQDMADASVQEALDAGINHFDVAASYGEAELRLGAVDAADPRPTSSWRPRPGSATPRRRGRRSTRSLERLRTDHVDLLQLHAVGDLEELDRVTRARRRARGRGAGAGGGPGRRRRHHRPRPQRARTHLEALRRFPFATVLTPLNAVLWREEASATTTPRWSRRCGARTPG